jgi:hypothetical protein
MALYNLRKSSRQIACPAARFSLDTRVRIFPDFGSVFPGSKEI